MTEIEQKFRKYFKPWELVSYKQYHDLGHDPEKIYALFSIKIKEVIVYLRESFNVPFIINDWHNYDDLLLVTTIASIEKCNNIDILEQRGYRGDDCKIGSKNSQHRVGNAFDLTIKGFTPLQARNLIRDRFIKGLPHPIRMEEDVNWVHIDCANYSDKKIKYFKA